MHNEKFGSKNEFFGTLLTANDIDDDIKNRLMRMLLKEEGEIKSIEELVKAKIKSKHKDEKQILASNLLTSILNNDYEDVESLLDDYDCIDNLQDGQSICLFYRDKFPQGYNLLNEILEHIATCNKMQYNVCKERLCNKHNLLNIIKSLQAVCDTEEYMEDPCGVDHICDIPVVDGLPVGAYALGGNWFKSIGSKIRNSYNKTKEKLGGIANDAKEKLGTFGKETRQNVKDLSNKAKEKLQDFGSKISSGFQNFGNNIKSGLEQTKEKVKSGVEEAKDNASDFFNNVKNGIEEWSSKFKEDSMTFTKKMIDAHNKDTSREKNIDNIDEKAYPFFKNLADNISPKYEIGKFVYDKMQELTAPLLNGLDKINNETSKVIDGTLKKKINFDNESKAIDSIVKNISSKVSIPKEKYINFKNNILYDLKSSIKNEAKKYADNHEKDEFLTNLAEDIYKYDKNNTDPEKVREAHYIQGYRGDNVIKEKLGPTFAIGDMIFYDLDNDKGTFDSRKDTLDHEYGHNRQYDNIGFANYLLDVALPSMNGWLKKNRGELVDKYGNSMNYYSDQPWENGANKLGEVEHKLDYKGKGNIGYDKNKAVVGDKQDILIPRYRKKKLLQWLDNLN